MKSFIRLIASIIVFGFLAGMAIMVYEGNKTPPVVDPKLQVYVDQWRRDMDSAGVTYNWNRLDYIRLVERIPSGILGDGDPMRAGWSDYSSRSVYVRNDPQYLPIHVKVIVYHELAHYLLGVEEHSDRGQIMGLHLVEDPLHYTSNWSILLKNYIDNISNGR